MNTTISSKQAREQFAEILNQVAYAGREFVIKRFERPVAKISPVESLFDVKEKNRRRNIVKKIMKMRRIYHGIDLANIVIYERDKEYKKWTQ
jgi:antitoxin (DNA-binding transcriptional repressor) of toxin-antitoxin stability system